ncbi:MAG: putative O-glycosylation ligase, exosortase A system-associated [Hydrogenophaga sp.]|uniref:putative O-glycosylation ligase, exosortase A system-associated n=1 Tax=Hydrogenophaga sp. TaxID=1904254 RepID=UPI003D12942A
MRSIFLSLVYFAILFLGTQAPLVFVLGYVWVDIFVPQVLAYSILPSIPVSMVMGVCVVGSLFFMPRDQFIKLRAITLLTFVLAVWMTATLLWAEVPYEAHRKWDWAVKSVAFSCLIPFFLRQRVDLEAFLWTIVISGIAHCLPFGVKVLISGGGYGKPLGLVQVNHGYGEGSTLAMFAISLIPLCLYLYRWQTLIDNKKLARVMLSVFMVMAFLTSLGTYARTGLISMGVLGVLLILNSKNVFRNFVFVALAGVLALIISSDQWMTRMSTIGDGTEGSAMGRVAVWLWTLEYISTNPWGGSFESYMINETSLVLADGSTLAVDSKAFHSIYFEILGETGIPGLLLFLTITFLTFRSYVAFARPQGKESDGWRGDLGMRLKHTLLIYLAGGAFIGIGFQAYFYYLAALGVALINLRLRPDAET